MVCNGEEIVRFNTLVPRGIRKTIRKTIEKNLDDQFHNAYDRLKSLSDVTIGDVLRKVFHAPPNMLPGWSCNPVDDAIYDVDDAYDDVTMRAAIGTMTSSQTYEEKSQWTRRLRAVTKRIRELMAEILSNIEMGILVLGPIHTKSDLIKEKSDLKGEMLDVQKKI